MKKLLKLYSLALAFGLSYSVANAQTTNNNEGAARMPETEGTTIVVETEKKAVVTPKENNVVVSENKVKPAKTVEANTEVEFKNLNTTKKIVKGDRIKKHLKPEKKEQTNVSKTTKLAVVLIIIGLILSLFLWTTLWYLGSLLVVVGLIILLLDFLDMI